MNEIDINDIIEETRDGKSLIMISREYGVSIKLVRHLRQEAIDEGYLTQTDIEEEVNESGQVSLTLLARGGEVPLKSGLNWGLANANVNANDAYIPIRKVHLKSGFFHRHGAVYSVKWDDGTMMQLVAEGTQELDGNGPYPKQLTSYPEKFVLGAYMRNRLAVPAPIPVTKNHLLEYGRTDVTVTFHGNNEVGLDFSVS